MQRVTYKSCEARSAPLRFTTGPLHFISKSPMTKMYFYPYICIKVHFFVLGNKRTRATFKSGLWSTTIKYYSFGDISAIYFQRKIAS